MTYLTRSPDRRRLIVAGARHEPGGTSTLIGAMLAGWGLFNTVEGVVDHHLLRLHHVRPGPDELLYDLGFLVWGVVMLVLGLAMVRTAGRRPPSRKAPVRPGFRSE